MGLKNFQIFSFFLGTLSSCTHFVTEESPLLDVQKISVSSISKNKKNESTYCSLVNETTLGTCYVEFCPPNQNGCKQFGNSLIKRMHETNLSFDQESTDVIFKNYQASCLHGNTEDCITMLKKLALNGNLTDFHEIFHHFCLRNEKSYSCEFQEVSKYHRVISTPNPVVLEEALPRSYPDSYILARISKK